MDSKAADLQAVKNVVQMVARSFFGPEEIAVLDGLLFLTGPERQSIQDEELAKELHLQHKVVRAALSRLERACLVRSFERKEMKGVKEIQQQYWRIDYKLFLDAVKLRIHKMKKALGNAQKEAVTLYVCESCVDAEGRNPSWTEYEVNEVLNMDLGTFECPHCSEELTERSEDKTEEGGRADIHPRMQRQLKNLMEALKKTEDVVLPAPKPESSFVPPKQDKSKTGEGGIGGTSQSGALMVHKTINITLAGDAGPVAGGWGNASSSAGGPGTPNALGSFQALHGRDEGGASGGGAAQPAKADPAFQEWLRNYQEECKKAEDTFGNADGGDDKGGWRGDGDEETGAAVKEGEDDDDEFEDEEEGGEEDEDEDAFEDEVEVMVAGRPMRLSEITEEMEATMSTKEYEAYCQARAEADQE